MSCTVFAVPYALAWVVGSLIVGAAGVNKAGDFATRSDYEDILEKYAGVKNLPNVADDCEDVHIISEKNFIEKSFETPFMDKEILLKTLEEHGVKNIHEDYGKISGQVESYSLTFEKMEEDKPYFLRISCLENDKPEEKLDDLNSEYALNVQEEAYLSIIEKLKANNMHVEEEEVQDDNTIVLTVNLE